MGLELWDCRGQGEEMPPDIAGLSTLIITSNSNQLQELMGVVVPTISGEQPHPLQTFSTFSASYIKDKSVFLAEYPTTTNHFSFATEETQVFSGICT